MPLDTVSKPGLPDTEKKKQKKKLLFALILDYTFLFDVILLSQRGF